MIIVNKRTILGIVLLTLLLGCGATTFTIGLKVHKNGDTIVANNVELDSDSAYITHTNIGANLYTDLSISVYYYPEFISTSGNVTIILPFGSTVTEESILNDYINGSGYSGFYRYKETGDLNNNPGVVVEYSEIISPDNVQLISVIDIVVVGVNDNTQQVNPTPINVTIEISYKYQDFWQGSTLLFFVTTILVVYSGIVGMNFFKKKKENPTPMTR